MIRSMTAFSRQECDSPLGVLSWELRTVNHRYVEYSLRMPEELRVLEGRVRERLAGKIKRGKVDAVLRFKPAVNADAELVLNEVLAKMLLEANKKITEMIEKPATINSLDILRWPGVLQAAETDLDQLQSEAMKLLDIALQELYENRQREGGKIAQIIGRRCDGIQQQLLLAREHLPEVLSKQRERLLKRLEELKSALDTTRLEQEIAYIAQKIDVEEELDRIDVHLEEVRRVLAQDEPVGRRLDFLMQEFNREANTLGSKSIDSETTRVSVEIKVLIEQMREQIQNIE